MVCQPGIQDYRMGDALVGIEGLYLSPGVYIKDIDIASILDKTGSPSALLDSFYYCRDLSHSLVEVSLNTARQIDRFRHETPSKVCASGNEWYQLDGDLSDPAQKSALHLLFNEGIIWFDPQARLIRKGSRYDKTLVVAVHRPQRRFLECWREKMYQPVVVPTPIQV